LAYSGRAACHIISEKRKYAGRNMSQLSLAYNNLPDRKCRQLNPAAKKADQSSGIGSTPALKEVGAKSKIPCVRVPAGL